MIILVHSWAPHMACMAPSKHFAPSFRTEQALGL